MNVRLHFDSYKSFFFQARNQVKKIIENLCVKPISADETLNLEVLFSNSAIENDEL